MIYFKKINDKAKRPKRGSRDSAGLDLTVVENAEIPAGKSATLKTGIKVAIPRGYCGLIWARSKLGAKKQIQVLAGVIDSDYRGEIMVALLNSGDKTFEVRKGDKIAQMIIQKHYSNTPLVKVENLDQTERGTEGINSTDLRIK